MARTRQQTRAPKKPHIRLRPRHQAVCDMCAKERNDVAPSKGRNLCCRCRRSLSPRRKAKAIASAQSAKSRRAGQLVWIHHDSETEIHIDIVSSAGPKEAPFFSCPKPLCQSRKSGFSTENHEKPFERYREHLEKVCLPKHKTLREVKAFLKASHKDGEASRTIANFFTVKRDYVKAVDVLEVRPTTLPELEKPAEGAFVRKAVRKGTVLGSYAGKRIEQHELEGLERDKGSVRYVFELDGGGYIDGAQGGNATSKVNDAPDHCINAAFESFVHEDGLEDILLKAVRPIGKRREVFAPYGLKYWTPDMYAQVKQLARR